MTKLLHESHDIRLIGKFSKKILLKIRSDGKCPSHFAFANRLDWLSEATLDIVF